jgi:dihydrodipicolinate synthase/N-acetylneuraminate lyase
LILAKPDPEYLSLTVLKNDYAAARKLFFRMLPTLELMAGSGKYTQFVKAACGLAGHPVGPPRRPLLIPTAAERALLRKALSKTGEV